MIVRVLLFARYREAAGQDAVEVRAEPGATVGQVWDLVRGMVPALSGESRPLFACNQAYADRSRVLDGREEVAAFPPVSGG